jgi:glycosyltransferase involved in cell wall biosynthesis
MMAHMYSAMDVLLNPSYGEGFGVPIVEAQACGTPVIVTDWTAMSELCGAGWLVGGEPWDDVKHRAFYLAPSVPGIHAALEAAFEAQGDQEVADRAVAFAAQYDADRVFDTYWVPALEKLTAPREVAPLPGINREMRRKMAKAGKREVAA